MNPSPVSVRSLARASTSPSSSPSPSNWYSPWLPKSEDAYRNPDLSTLMLEHTGMVSKYLTATSVTRSSAWSRVTLKMSPYSVCTRKKNMAFCLCVAVATTRTPRSCGRSCRRGIAARTSRWSSCL